MNLYKVLNSLSWHVTRADRCHISSNFFSVMLVACKGVICTMEIKGSFNFMEKPCTWMLICHWIVLNDMLSARIHENWIVCKCAAFFEAYFGRNWTINHHWYKLHCWLNWYNHHWYNHLDVSGITPLAILLLNMEWLTKLFLTQMLCII